MVPGSGDPRQQWYLDGNKIINRSSGQCLDISGADQKDGAQVISYDNNGAINQQWSQAYVN